MDDQEEAFDWETDPEEDQDGEGDRTPVQGQDDDLEKLEPEEDETADAAEDPVGHLCGLGKGSAGSRGGSQCHQTRPWP